MEILAGKRLCVFVLTKCYFPSWQTKEWLNFFVSVITTETDNFTAHQEWHLTYI